MRAKIACVAVVAFILCPFVSDPLQGAIIADHNAVREFDQIPADWLERAKELTIQYAHRSDGNQVIEGAYYLRTMDPARYRFLEQDNVLPAQTNPIALRMMDGNPPLDNYSYDYRYWSTPAAIAATSANVGSGAFDASMWSWCTEMVSASTAYVQSYLDQMDRFSDQFPGVTFILMTGYNDPSATNLRNNQMIRDYAIANDKVLFDFEDILKYDPAGNYHADADRGCNWCTSWCTSHPGDCQTLPSCSHASGAGRFSCVLRGKAFWWLMARLAGWPGVNPGSSPTPTPSAGASSNPTPTPSPTPSISSLTIHPFKNKINPKKESVQIRYTLTGSGHITAVLYDKQGKEVRALLDEERAGNGSFSFNGKNNDGAFLSSGVYTLIIKSGSSQETKRIIVVK